MHASLCTSMSAPVKRSRSGRSPLPYHFRKKIFTDNTADNRTVAFNDREDIDTGLDDDPAIYHVDSLDHPLE